MFITLNFIFRKYDSDINEEGNDSNRATGDKPGSAKQDDPMVDLFPDDDNEERNSGFFFCSNLYYLRSNLSQILKYRLNFSYVTYTSFTICTASQRRL